MPETRLSGDPFRGTTERAPPGSMVMEGAAPPCHSTPGGAWSALVGP
jgi:hypothetical protein